MITSARKARRFRNSVRDVVYTRNFLAAVHLRTVVVFGRNAVSVVRGAELKRLRAPRYVVRKTCLYVVVVDRRPCTYDNRVRKTLHGTISEIRGSRRERGSVIRNGKRHRRAQEVSVFVDMSSNELVAAVAKPQQHLTRHTAAATATFRA
ncbi:uncharacterized protein LOC112688833 [Sipha flava]|uniref:Uncharacterized protein LOC112688833 n=1 Tax=Sipha flava TaxID=143950 RepID=A0A8B8G597_9HEMI|nr:uncharacterized protein LOC112688833 [Sipha flava]